jgi:hypothetical protein
MWSWISSARRPSSAEGSGQTSTMEVIGAAGTGGKYVAVEGGNEQGAAAHTGDTEPVVTRTGAAACIGDTSRRHAPRAPSRRLPGRERPRPWRGWAEPPLVGGDPRDSSEGIGADDGVGDDRVAQSPLQKHHVPVRFGGGRPRSDDHQGRGRRRRR